MHFVGAGCPLSRPSIYAPAPMLPVGLWLFRVFADAALRRSPVTPPNKVLGLPLHFSPPRRTSDRCALLRGFGLGRRVIAAALASLALRSLLRARVGPPPISCVRSACPSLSLCARRRAQRCLLASGRLRPAAAGCLAFRPSGALPPLPRLTFYICVRLFNFLTFVTLCALFVQSFDVLQ